MPRPPEAYHLFDGAGWSRLTSLARATRLAQQALAEARRSRDPDWPVWTRDIGIYRAPFTCRFPDEDGTIILAAKQVAEPPEEAYILAPPERDPEI